MWTKTRPRKAGWYWYWDSDWGRKRIIYMWNYEYSPDLLFTDEDGTLVDDPIYSVGYWMGSIQEPKDPEDISFGELTVEQTDRWNKQEKEK